MIQERDRITNTRPADDFGAFPVDVWPVLEPWPLLPDDWPTLEPWPTAADELPAPEDWPELLANDWPDIIDDWPDIIDDWPPIQWEPLDL